jgi:cytochrome o ubiquinol oxidase subunit 2
MHNYLSMALPALFNPQGDIGMQEKDLILISMGLMLLVVIPVILLTLYFAWRYRETNTKATYSPKWAHSTKIEIVVWTIPCVIVAVLAVLIWTSTHALDPYKPIESKAKPVRVEVVALNWKWLFIYPDYGIASVNELRFPVDTPVEFKLTAESLMNSFFIPQLGSQVYAMSGMQTKLHLIANHPGTFNGMSAAFSGSGFSDMHFKAIAGSNQEFDAWVAQARKAPLKLDQERLAMLERPTNGAAPEQFSQVTPGLFLGVVNKYMGDMSPDLCLTPPAIPLTHNTAE